MVAAVSGGGCVRGLWSGAMWLCVLVALAGCGKPEDEDRLSAAVIAENAARRAQAASMAKASIAERLAACSDAAIADKLAVARTKMAGKLYIGAREALEHCKGNMAADSEGAKLYAAAVKAIAQREEASRIMAERADKAARRQQGVSIGMTQQNVLDSNWGKPTKINRTVTAAGTTEQWVYGGGNYLYFGPDGTLRTVQTAGGK